MVVSGLIVSGNTRFCNMRAASALMNEFIARAYPYRQEPNRNYARVAFSLAACDEDHHSEDDFARKENDLLGRGTASRCLACPCFERQRRKQHEDRALVQAAVTLSLIRFILNFSDSAATFLPSSVLGRRDRTLLASAS